MSITREELAEVLDGRDKLCRFCENYDFCTKCQVTLLVDQAFAECEDYCEDDDDYDYESEE